MIELGGSPLLRALVVTPHGHFGDPRPLRNGTHFGVDFQAAAGDPVLSVSSGAVARTGFDKPVAEGGGGGGNFVIVRSLALPPELAPSQTGRLQPYELGYMHLERVDVAAGDAVAVGQQLGAAGATGTVDNAPHLHFQVNFVGDPSGVRHINPEKLLPIGATTSSPVGKLLGGLAVGWVAERLLKHRGRR